jgi:hypothetical protein
VCVVVCFKNDLSYLGLGVVDIPASWDSEQTFKVVLGALIIR